MKKETLIITYHKDAYFYPFVKDKNLHIKEPIKNKSILSKIFFRIPFLSIFVYDFLNELESCEKIIIFDSAYNWALGFYLRKIRKIKNVYLYYWNPIKKMYPKKGEKMVFSAKKFMKVYSFDHDDCKRYDLKYAPMVYSEDVASEINNISLENIEYDLFFLGWKKDRYKQLLQLYNKYMKGKLKVKIIMIGSKDDSDIDEDFIFSEKRYEYREYLDFVIKSRAILDIPQVGQEGLTIRNVESMFLRKKLITTKKNIRNYDFYNPNNIFILGEDDPNKFSDFMKSEYQDIDEKIKRNYEFKYWIDKFK